MRVMLNHARPKNPGEGMNGGISGRRLPGPVSVAAVLFAAQLACSFSGGTAAKTAPSIPGQKTEAGTFEPTAAMQGGAAAEGGFTCFGFGEWARSVTCLSDSGWKTYTSEDLGVAAGSVQDLAACPDGNIYASTGYGLTKFDGNQWTSIPYTTDYVMLYIACGPDGSIWIGTAEGVTRYADGTSKKMFSAAEFNTTEISGTIWGLEVAPDGTVWVAGTESIVKYDGTSWTEYREGSGFDKTPDIEGLAVDSKGRVWLGGGKFLYRYEQNRWTTIEMDKYYVVLSLTTDPQDRIWVNTDSGVLVFDGANWSGLSYRTGEIHGNRIFSAAFDQAGRTWLGMQYGIDVLAGGTWIHYRMDNADLPDNEIEHLAVIGGGPALPAAATKKPGSIVGRIATEAGAPASNARMEICVEKTWGYHTGDTLCSGQPFVKAGETDANGEFLLTDLPAGYYFLTLEVDGDWQELWTKEGFLRVLVEEGKETDAGELAIRV